MKTFVYKTLFIFVCIFLLFQLTIGVKLKQLNNELTKFKSKKNIEIINKYFRININTEEVLLQHPLHYMLRKEP